MKNSQTVIIEGFLNDNPKYSEFSCVITKPVIQVHTLESFGIEDIIEEFMLDLALENDPYNERDEVSMTTVYSGLYRARKAFKENKGYNKTFNHYFKVTAKYTTDPEDTTVYIVTDYEGSEILKPRNLM